MYSIFKILAYIWRTSFGGVLNWNIFYMINGLRCLYTCSAILMSLNRNGLIQAALKLWNLTFTLEAL